MSGSRIYIAACAGTVVFFVFGYLVHGLLVTTDYPPYPAGVFRPAAGQMSRSEGWVFWWPFLPSRRSTPWFAAA